MAIPLDPEQVWDDTLSRDEQRILSAWKRLNGTERTALLSHLERMTSESGWHAEQVTSARRALEVIHQAAGLAGSTLQ